MGKGKRFGNKGGGGGGVDSGGPIHTTEAWEGRVEGRSLRGKGAEPEHGGVQISL